MKKEEKGKGECVSVNVSAQRLYLTVARVREAKERIVQGKRRESGLRPVDCGQTSVTGREVPRLSREIRKSGSQGVGKVPPGRSDGDRYLSVGWWDGGMTVGVVWTQSNSVQLGG